jgi:hypothetical protein
MFCTYSRLRHGEDCIFTADAVLAVHWDAHTATHHNPIQNCHVRDPKQIFLIKLLSVSCRYNKFLLCCTNEMIQHVFFTKKSWKIKSNHTLFKLLTVQTTSDLRSSNPFLEVNDQNLILLKEMIAEVKSELYFNFSLFLWSGAVI